MVRIVIDSACDMELSRAKELGLDFMPLKTIFGEDEYLDGVTISHEQFFEKLIECGTMPTTSQISPYDFEKKFEEIRGCRRYRSSHHTFFSALRHLPECHYRSLRLRGLHHCR